MTRFYKRFLQTLLLAGAALLAQAPTLALAEGIETGPVALQLQDEGYQLTAEYTIELPLRLEEALKAVPLYFLFEFDLSRRRWYWLDEEVASGSVSYRLSYNALTRQYRVAVQAGATQTGNLPINFATLEEALRLIARVRREAVVGTSALVKGERYRLSTRMRLDVSQLPKPFQLAALTQKEWTLDSDVRRTTIEPKTP
jgi:hypothetical protein